MLHTSRNTIPTDIHSQLPNGRRSESMDMDQRQLFELYQDLQVYLGWTEEDVKRVRELRPLIEDSIGSIIEDFYAEIERHADARRVITGGTAQIERLKGTLREWLLELVTGPYDEVFTSRRFRVGKRHVEIGLSQFYASTALSRIRLQLITIVSSRWTGSREDLNLSLAALNRLMDLDLAIIEFAYQSEFTAREQRQERLVTLGQVAAGIAHELRNPLNTVRTSVYYLLNARDPSPEKTREHLERIDRQVSISNEVITALSEFARLPQPKVGPIDLCDFVQHALTVTPLPSQIELELACSEPLPPVMGDAAQLTIVLSNLIRNAVDAMPDGGTLKLTGRLIRNREGEVTTDLVALDVTDTGHGIPQEQLKRIMEPLFTTKARGLGLGLALARAIMEKHHGSLTVLSRPGHGTTFTMRLPLAPDSSNPLPLSAPVSGETQP